MSQYNVQAGRYKVKVYFFTSDDGKHYEGEYKLEKEFTLTFINRLLGLAGVESTDETRIINKTTGTNLTGEQGLDILVTVGAPTNESNIRVELYKRTPTYNVEEDGTMTYTGTGYTQVDIKDYLQGNWLTPEECIGQNLVTTEGTKEYVILPKEDYTEPVDKREVTFDNEIIKGISTGEYKLIFKAYHENTLVQAVRKTFVVAE